MRSSADPQAIRDHLARFPLGPIAHRAQNRLQTLIWSSLGPSPDLGAVRVFLNEFSKGACVGTAKRRLSHFEEEAWLEASRAYTAEAYSAFVQAWPNGRHALSAKRRLSNMEKNAAEQRAKEASEREAKKAWAVDWSGVQDYLPILVALAAGGGVVWAFVELVHLWESINVASR